MKLIALAAALLAIGAIITIHSGLGAPAFLGLGTALALVEVAALLKRARGFTTMIVPIIVVNGMLLGAVLVWPVVGPVAVVSARLSGDNAELTYAATVGMVFTAAFTLGAMLIGAGEVKPVSLALRKKIALPPGILLSTSAAVLGLTLVAYGGTILRGDYLGATGPEWAGIASIALTPLAVLAACIVASSKDKSRYFAICMLVIWSLVLFGRSSRTLAAIPVFLLLGKIVVGQTKLRWYQVLAAGAFCILLLQIPLTLRANESGVGILTLAEALMANGSQLVESFNLDGILGNLFFSAPLVSVTAAQSIPTEAFWVSVSPAFGESAGWMNFAPALRVNPSTPFNALGELAAHGWAYLVSTAFLTACAFAFSERMARKMDGLFGALGPTLILAITTLYSVTILQYNLRNSTRLVWYTLAGMGLIFIIGRFLKHASNSRGSREVYAKSEMRAL